MPHQAYGSVQVGVARPPSVAKRREWAPRLRAATEEPGPVEPAPTGATERLALAAYGFEPEELLDWAAWGRDQHARRQRSARELEEEAADDEFGP